MKGDCAAGLTIAGTVFAGSSPSGAPGIAGDTVTLLETKAGTPVAEQTVETAANGQTSESVQIIQRLAYTADMEP